MEPTGVNAITGAIIGAAIEVHRELGPGLLESAYEQCLARELALREVRFTRQQALEFDYKGEHVDAGYRLDLVVDDRVIVELKSVDRLSPLHDAQLITYMKLSGIEYGLLMNFNVRALRQGIRRLTIAPQPRQPSVSSVNSVVNPSHAPRD